MGTVEKFLGGAIIAIIVYILVINNTGTAAVLNGFAQLASGVFGTLQGRGVSYSGSGVTVGR